MHLVLVGLMASGKTTVGHLLATSLDRRFVDNDDMLFRRTGHTARDIADDAGSTALHDAEADILVAALSEPDPAVIGAAAGAVLEPDARRALEGHFIVYLRATPEVLADRIEANIAGQLDDGHRPFVTENALEVLREQAAERDGPSRPLATLIVDAARDPAVTAREISTAFARA